MGMKELYRVPDGEVIVDLFSDDKTVIVITDKGNFYISFGDDPEMYKIIGFK